MSRGALTAGAIMFALLFGIPLVVVGGWSTLEIVAWGLFTAICASLVAIAYDASDTEL